LVARGAVQVSTPPAAAGGGVVFSMLTDDAAVERVCAGADGIVAGLPEGGVHVSCSTITAAAGARLASLHAAAGRGFARVRGRD
jgi:3-hydroxyisobutyrate dehydrogenase-like beta-hydroxyacid dehydrogenase